MEALRQSQAIGGNARFAQSFYPSTYMLRGGGVMLAGYRRAEAAGAELGPKPVMWEVQQQQPKEELLRPGLEQWQVRLRRVFRTLRKQCLTQPFLYPLQPIALINLTENVQDDDLDPLPLPSAGQRVRIAVLVAPPTALQTKAPRPLTEEALVDGEEEDEGELDIELATTTVDVVRL